MEKREITKALQGLASNLDAHASDTSAENLRGVVCYAASDLRRLADEIQRDGGQAEEA